MIIKTYKERKDKFIDYALYGAENLEDFMYCKKYPDCLNKICKFWRGDHCSLREFIEDANAELWNENWELGEPEDWVDIY